MNVKDIDKEIKKHQKKIKELEKQKRDLISNSLKSRDDEFKEKINKLDIKEEYKILFNSFDSLEPIMEIEESYNYNEEVEGYILAIRAKINKIEINFYNGNETVPTELKNVALIEEYPMCFVSLSEVAEKYLKDYNIVIEDKDKEKIKDFYKAIEEILEILTDDNEKNFIVEKI